MKHVIVASIVTGVLAGCTAGSPGMSVGIGLGTGIGRHIGLGTSLNIPISLDQNKTKQTEQNALKETGVIAYFDANGVPSNSAVKGGFYRQLISKRNQEYVVQDFYSDNERKRTDPYTLNRENLTTFRAFPRDGSLVTYSYNGDVMQQQIFKNGRLVSAKY